MTPGCKIFIYKWVLMTVKQSHYIEVAQGGESSRARHNWLWILSLFWAKRNFKNILYLYYICIRDIVQLFRADATMFKKNCPWNDQRRIFKNLPSGKKWNQFMWPLNRNNANHNFLNHNHFYSTYIDVFNFTDKSEYYLIIFS